MAGNSRQFRFDATTHSYWVGRRRLPSITQILRATASAPAGDGWYTDEAADRGTRIHLATMRFDLSGGWGDDVLEPDLPRVRAYAEFLQAMRPVYLEIEQPRWSKRFGFAGTPDRVGHWPDGRLFVLDIKTGPAGPDHGLQTAAQALLIDGRIDLRLRYTLHLRPNGRFLLMPWRDPQDYTAFLARLRRFTEGDTTDGNPG